ncbi:hypothetical protein CHGG_07078 [Chaetomium globosum CBS 148.51]|uniref:Aminoglycoside phosphotransferase domain-containing protein n=1 Tax=Chaetomium globosum (strain ATCC 6205 / CBS 148.51 / DSM 1962 / NBRC 6347 / NRRL 1970) TaxID=306901 RepID=Q2GY76_CHAGB|nr:uncharacterized protein CHGG_07078 [Chaetomium globosum CBS 148.51]EAQ85825.1 hypothetical protein CHGG_07078 [Chaetomium globosum CBS 148.51]
MAHRKQAHSPALSRAARGGLPLGEPRRRVVFHAFRGPSSPACCRPARPWDPDGHDRQIHDAGDVSAVFSFGDEIVIKIRLATDETRREPETLASLAKQQQHLSFDIHTVHFYVEDAGKTYLDRLRQQLDEPTARDAQRQCRGRPTAVRDCEALGMDCSVFVLAHNDLGPTNIIVDGDRIVVVDWQMAGYVPLEWVRTKFASCGVLGVERVRTRGPGGEGPVRVTAERNGEYRVSRCVLREGWRGWDFRRSRRRIRGCMVCAKWNGGQVGRGFNERTASITENIRV